ncbi:MAG: LptF/LptG family permease [Planctomycetes bacterium]|nr:LptF/LptG family permease [Planctomycetota bacterium]
MFDRLDRYVARPVLSAWGFAFLFLVFMLTVFDVLLNVARYVTVAERRGLSVAEMLLNLLHYHLLGVPFVFVTVAPFVTVIAAMFALASLMANSEMVPMLFSGRSMLRNLRVVLVTAAGAAAAMACLWSLVIPALVEPRERLQNLLTKEGSAAITLDTVVLRDPGDPRRTLFANRYLHEQLKMEGVLLFDRGLARGDEVAVRAASATWNPERRDWELEAGVRQTGTRILAQAMLELGTVTPEIVWRSGKDRSETTNLSYAELRELRELRPNRRDFVIAYHQHLTFPLANIVLLLLALPFAVHFERGRRIERVLVAIGVCAAYLVTDLTCQNLGYRGDVHPVVAAWSPTILFGSLGVVLFGAMRT